jgi:phosphoribosylglycinamide formyltransferase-1
MRTAVLASGGGSNLQALLEAEARGALAPAKIIVVGANIAGCGALTRAEKAEIPTFLLNHKNYPSREAFDQALVEHLRSHQVELVVLAGFMRILTPTFLSAFPQRVMNIHPALLPSFPGVHGQKQAFDYGVKVAGCTVHFVDSGTDTGPIIAQSVVPVLDDDTEESLQQRILTEEHRIFPLVVKAVAEGRVRVEGRRVRIETPKGLTEQRLRSIEGM